MSTKQTANQRAYAKLKRRLDRDPEFRKQYIMQRRRDQAKSRQVIKERYTEQGVLVQYVVRTEKKPTATVYEMPTTKQFDPLEGYNYPYKELRKYTVHKNYKVKKGELMQTIKLSTEESLVLQRALFEFQKTTIQTPAANMLGMTADEAQQYQHDVALMMYTRGLITKLNSGAFE